MIKTFKEFSVNESHEDLQNYMFFSNLETIKRKCEAILAMDFKKIDELLNAGGHDWAADHIAVAKENIDQVETFLTGEIKSMPDTVQEAEAHKAYKSSTDLELAVYIINLNNELGGEKDPKKIKIIKDDLEEVKKELESRKKK
jgi:hypothetical protein